MNRLDEPIFIAVSKPLLTEFGIHYTVDCMQSCVVYPMLYALLKLISFVAYFIRLTLCNCCNGLGCKAQPPDSTATLLTGVSSALRNRMNLEGLKFPPVSAELRDRLDPSPTPLLPYIRSYSPSPPGVPFRPENSGDSGILPDFFFSKFTF